jgi:hypothetical protein
MSPLCCCELRARVNRCIKLLLSLVLSGPEGYIVPHQLQNHRALFVVLLVHCVDIGDRFLECSVR